MCLSTSSRHATERVFQQVSGMADVAAEVKKESVHVTAGKAAFLGLHPRKAGIRLNIVLARRLEGPRIVKSEQTSKERFHNEIEMDGSTPIDAELAGWIEEAYLLQTQAAD
jgi:hypothetical protein